MSFEVFPYTNFHEMNLDWLISLVKKLAKEWEETGKDWKEFREYVENYLKNLKVPEEVQKILEEMKNNGELNNIIENVIFNFTKLKPDEETGKDGYLYYKETFKDYSVEKNIPSTYESLSKGTGDSSNSFSVGSFNVVIENSLRNKGMFVSYLYRITNTLINWCKADYVSLQETWDLPDYPCLESYGKGYYKEHSSIFEQNIYPSGKVGTSLFSRKTDISNKRGNTFTQGEGSYSFFQIVRSGVTIGIYSVHLDHHRTATSAQLKEIYNLTLADKCREHIVVGDFNLNFNNDEIISLKPFTDAGYQFVFTEDTTIDWGCIDNIVYSNGLTMSNKEVLDISYLRDLGFDYDHFPIRCTFTL